ncbi:4Fe-4S dicluster domain-containing protein [Salinispira pacifica]
MAGHAKALVVNRNWCKGCRICVAFCPQDVLELDGEEKVVIARIGDCAYCGLCELRCPDLAILLQPIDSPIVADGAAEPRHEIFTV